MNGKGTLSALGEGKLQIGEPDPVEKAKVAFLCVMVRGKILRVFWVDIHWQKLPLLCKCHASTFP